MIRLVATDLDGTLLHTDKTVNAWTRSVLDAVQDRGVPVVPVTARQPLGLQPISEQTGLLGWSVCVNGALVRHATTGEVLFEQLVGCDEMRQLVGFLDRAAPGTVFATVRDQGATFGMQAAYRAVTGPDDHQPAIRRGVEMTLDEVVAEPALKLLARHPELPAVELAARIAAAGLGAVHATTSGADFVEMAAAGVTKATGLARLCERLGVDPAEVVAFGDAPNDVEMLAWAGQSWAMVDAVAQAKAAAGRVTTAGHDDDGVARTLMELMRTGQL